MIRLYYARSLNNVISVKGQSPWKIQDDAIRFRRLTKNNFVVMTDRYYDSLPKAIRPIPNRTNVVISADFDRMLNDDILVYLTFDDFLTALLSKKRKMNNRELMINDNIWVVGDSVLLQEAVEHANELCITTVYENVTGDNLEYGPIFDFHEWKIESKSAIRKNEIRNEKKEVIGINHYTFDKYFRVKDAR